ncbi:MAG: TIGR04084 family radical SAM/SPASM domain-containing protein [Candidatus Thorarchaeota archaeon]|nr:TIGR04084 family radical SAM/SPASM domain-containing protein [Candidatus Thorarchaeota archaeon]
MNYHLVLTRRCNLNCIYCHGGEETGPNAEIQYTIDQLEDFLKKDDDVQLMFYGGEPLLRIPLLTKLMERFPNARFMLQTNALLLDRIPPDYIRRFHSILVSIDGREETTDGYRSKGVYKKVVENARWVRAVGFKGDLVARMVVSEETDIYKDVEHLLDMRNPNFNHVHWQLNVIWDAEGNWSDFDGWVQNSYTPGIEKLVIAWLKRLREGEVRGVVPFIPVMYTLLTGENASLRCGSGIDTFAIHVDGSIGLCPISPDWEFSIIGSIHESDPSDLANAMMVEEPCPSCNIYGVCGGRCLFANKQRLWGEEGFEKVCSTVRHLVSSLRNILPEVEQLIRKGIIQTSDFRYPVYNNGCEIIP